MYVLCQWTKREARRRKVCFLTPTAACFAPPEVRKPSLALVRGTSGYDDICIADWSESNGHVRLETGCVGAPVNRLTDG